MRSLVQLAYNSCIRATMLTSCMDFANFTPLERAIKMLLSKPSCAAIIIVSVCLLTSMDASTSTGKSLPRSPTNFYGSPSHGLQGLPLLMMKLHLLSMICRRQSSPWLRRQPLFPMHTSSRSLRKEAKVGRVERVEKEVSLSTRHLVAIAGTV